MRLNPALLACTLATAAIADPQPRETTRARNAAAARAPEMAPPIAPGEKSFSDTPCSCIACRMSARWSPSS